MTLLLISIVFILPVVAIASYQHYKIGKQPAYDANETLLNYEIIGSGKNKLVLLHGLTGSLNYWKRELESITKTHSLLLIDLLGFGDSPKPKSDYSLSVQLQALELILKKEGFNDGKTTIAGHSMGAIISLALLEKYSHWFKAGIFIGIPVYKDVDEFKKVKSTHSFVDRICTIVGLHSGPLSGSNLDVFWDPFRYDFGSEYHIVTHVLQHRLKWHILKIQHELRILNDC